ncbi:MAG TPA: hypothetical protein VHR45_17505 [Thermoanaerobaculia bacterium]|nr:hypothetical protein [Thermoanaerobaculia bacterium]
MTQQAAQLLAELSARGVTLEPAGYFLRVSPPSAITPDLLARIRELKQEILSLFVAPPPADPVLRLAVPTPAERDTLTAVAARPGLRRRALVAATRLPRGALDNALSRLCERREIAIGADGRCHLVVH